METIRIGFTGWCRLLRADQRTLVLAGVNKVFYRLLKPRLSPATQGDVAGVA